MHDSQQTCLVIAIRNSYPKLLAGGNISKIALKQGFRATIQAKSNWLSLLQHAGQTAMKQIRHWRQTCQKHNASGPIYETGESIQKRWKIDCEQ